jgi:zinc/manganese transport system ATP-binding protein
MAHSDGVTISDLEVRYARRVVLSGLTMVAPRARVTAIVGPNGSGKSTLLGAIAGVVAPAAGSIERPNGPAFVVQRSAVSDTLPITVRETVAMGRWAHRGAWRRLSGGDRAIVEDCLARLDIVDLADRTLGTLSGGERQRALVAQGLAQQSDLLLLDEPATGLDAAADRRIAEAIDDAAAGGVTVVLATHDLAAAGRADHCVLLEEGRLVAQGPPESVLGPESCTRRASMCTPLGAQ